MTKTSVNDLCRNFSTLKLKKFRFEDYYYNEPIYKKILIKVNVQIRIFLNRFPYTYINNKKFSGTIENGDTIISWDTTITLYKPFSKKVKMNFCYVHSKLPQNSKLTKLNYFAIIKIKRLNFNRLSL